MFVLPSALWMALFLFLDECLKALISDVAKFSDGIQSLDKISYEDKAASENVAHCTSFFFLHVGITIQKVVKILNIQFI